MGTPIQLGSPGGFDRNKLLLIGGVVVAAIVLLGKMRGSASSSSSGGDQVVPVQAIQLGQLDYDLRTATNDLATRVTNAQAQNATAIQGVGDRIAGILNDPNTGLPFLGTQGGNNNSILNVNYAYLLQLRQALYNPDGTYRIGAPPINGSWLWNLGVKDTPGGGYLGPPTQAN